MSFIYQLNTYVPSAGQVFYGISRDGVVLSASELSSGLHTLCYGRFAQASTSVHAAHVDCDLADGNYLLWLGTGDPLYLNTPDGVKFSVQSTNGMNPHNNGRPAQAGPPNGRNPGPPNGMNPNQAGPPNGMNPNQAGPPNGRNPNQAGPPNGMNPNQAGSPNGINPNLHPNVTNEAFTKCCNSTKIGKISIRFVSVKL